MAVKGRKTNSSSDPKSIIKALSNHAKGMSLAELADLFQLSSKETALLKERIGIMLRQGLIRRSGRKGYKTSRPGKSVTGILDVRRSGAAFVTPESGLKKDIFIPRAFRNWAWPGDRVKVLLLPAIKKSGRGAAPARGQSSRHAEGRIVEVVERRTKALGARIELEIAGGRFLAAPVDSRYDACFVLEKAAVPEAMQSGEIIFLRPDKQLGGNQWSAELIAKLGPEESPLTQEALVKLSHDIPQAFPEEVLRAAALLPAGPDDNDLSGRGDLRALDFVTIDGADARDFDDAVYVEKNEHGFILHVAIADVAHYVTGQSQLDLEARRRGNSYYFPRSVEPMFPPSLSNGLCSLVPGEDRLVMHVRLTFDLNGRREGVECANAVIRSKARLAYDQVYAALAGGEQDAVIGPFLPMLRHAEELAGLLLRKRSKSGALDFDLPEARIVFSDDNKTFDIVPAERNCAHRLIEEFMIAANEAVAERLEAAGMPLLYRVHAEPDPDKITTLFNALKSTDLHTRMPAMLTAKALQELLERAEAGPFKFLVGRLVLRSMMQARYQPDNIGHFGLASACYCHFTSPIRRYADLTVHRQLKALLARSRPVYSYGQLKSLGDDLGVNERRAMEAEREIEKRLAIIWLRSSREDIFDGTISSLSDFGMWVEIDKVMAEGLVLISSMPDDYYDFIPERQEIIGRGRGQRFALGQRVRVQVMEASLDTLEITLKLVAGPEALKGADIPGQKAGKGPNRRNKPARRRSA